MSNFEIPDPKVNSLPAADVKITAGSEGLMQTEAYPVHPYSNKDDYVISIKRSLLEKIYNKLLLISEESFQWHEMSFLLFSFIIGIVVTAAFANIEYTKIIWICCFTILPVLAVALLVFGIMDRRYKYREKQGNIKDIIEEFKPIIEQQVK